MTRLSLLLALTVGCASTGEVPLDTAFSLRYGETVAVERTDLEITFADVTDSRCPRGTTCVWEGEVSVSLRVGAETVAIKVPGTANVSRYAVEVREVNPYPGDPPPAKTDYVATVVVRATPPSG